MFWDFWIEEFDEKILINLDFKGICTFKKIESNKIEVLIGEKINAKNTNDLKNKVKKSTANFLILENKEEKLQRIAIKTCSVDAIKAYVDYPAIKEMAEKNVALLICFSDFLNSKDKSRTLYLMQKSVALAKKYKTPIIIASGAKNKWELRSPSELIAFGEMLGLEKNQSKKALYDFQNKIYERETLKKQNKYVQPGVKII